MIGLVFAGQGSEISYMGKDFYEAYDYVKALYEKAEKLTGLPLREVVFSDDDTRLHETLYAQILLFLFDVFVIDELKKKDVNYELVFGLSLGEYGALYASDVFDVETGLQVIMNRARFMSNACSDDQAMAAILGLKKETLLPLLDQNQVYLANYNTPKQLVISGQLFAVEQVMEQALEAGAKRAIKLSTSGAFHTPFMARASEQFGTFLDNVELQEPNVTLLLNTTGKEYENQLKKHMKQQIVSSVYFYQSVEEAIKQGVDTFIEIAPKSVIKGMIKKVDRKINVVTITTLEDIGNLL